MAGVARGRLDDGPTRTEQAPALGVLDHHQGDAVRDAAPGVDRFELREDGRAHSCGDLVKADERSVADRVEDALEVLHGGASVPLVRSRHEGSSLEPASVAVAAEEGGGCSSSQAPS